MVTSSIWAVGSRVSGRRWNASGSTKADLTIWYSLSFRVLLYWRSGSASYVFSCLLDSVEVK